MGTDKKTERLIWLDGLKGLACAGVFTHHFFLHFFPQSYFGESEIFPAELNGFDTALAQSPAGVLINGNFWVNIFVLAATLLPAMAIMRCEREKLKEKAGSIILKRYPRLALPTAVVCVLYYVILKLLIAKGMNYTYKEMDLGPGAYMLHVLIIQFMQEDTAVMGALWTLHELLFGAFFAVLISIPSGRKKPAMLLAYLFAFAAFRLTNPNFCVCALAVLLADIICYDRIAAFRFFENKKAGMAVALCCLILGFFLGGYPSYVVPGNIYRYLGPAASLLTPVGIHAFAAALVVGGIFLFHRYSKRSILGTFVFRLMGRYCMGIYLMHLCWIELFGHHFNDICAAKFGKYPAYLICFAAVAVLTLISSAIFNILVERPWEKVCAGIRA